MSEILFIRHAETDMAGTFCGGRSDPELNARGRVQLAELIKTLRKEGINVVYTSDLRRTHQTGIGIAEAFGVDCHVRPALREIDFGQWEGLAWEEIERRDKAYALRWIAEYPHLQAPDGESFCDFERRVLVRSRLFPRRRKSPVAGSRLSLMRGYSVLCCAPCRDIPKRTRGNRPDRTAQSSGIRASLPHCGRWR